MHDKYGAGRDPYCYPDTDCLENLLDIRDTNELEIAEHHFTTARLEHFIPDFENLNFSYLKHLHRHLFQDLYHWAGKLRTIDISKGNTRFCINPNITKESEKLFKWLSESNNLQTLDLHNFTLNISHFFCELNVIHPFRDGNGRTSRLFCELLALQAGYELNWKNVDIEEWIHANEAGYYGNLNPLIDIFTKATTKLTPT